MFSCHLIEILKVPTWQRYFSHLFCSIYFTSHFIFFTRILHSLPRKPHSVMWPFFQEKCSFSFSSEDLSSVSYFLVQRFFPIDPASLMSLPSYITEIWTCTLSTSGCFNVSGMDRDTFQLHCIDWKTQQVFSFFLWYWDIVGSILKQRHFFHICNFLQNFHNELVTNFMY